MKVCSNCGNQNQDNAKFCNNCGYDFENIVQSQPQQNTQYDFNSEQQTNNQTYQQQNYQNQQNYQGYQPPIKQKIVWLGPLLNLIGGFLLYILSGIGQLYLGLYKRGIVLCALGLIPITIGLLVMVESNYLGSLASLIIGLILVIYSAYDAYICAKAINDGRPIPLLFNAIDLQ